MAPKFRDLFKSRTGAEQAGQAAVAAQVPGPAAVAGPVLPDDPYELALSLQRQGQLQQAVAQFDAAIARQPDRAEAHYKRANALNALGQWQAALAGYDCAVAIDGRYANAFCNRGTVLEKLGRRQEALDSYERTLALNAADAFAAYNRASLLRQLNRSEDALAGYDQAIALQPGYVEAHINRGHLLQELQRFPQAVASYDRAIEISATFPEAYMGRATALAQLARSDDALACYRQAIALKPGYAEAHINRGNLLLKLRRYADALADYDAAIAISSTFPEAYAARANALAALLRTDEALASYARAIELKIDCAEAYRGLANLQLRLHRYDEALESFDRAIEWSPDHAETHRGRGALLVLLRRFQQAIASYDRAVALNPDQKYIIGMRQYAKMQSCDWTDLESNIQLLVEGLEARRAVTVPLPVLALVDSPPLHRLAAEIWVREECPRDDGLGAVVVQPRRQRIRVGYFSADFRVHPVSLLTAQLFELHDRSRFEVTAFAFGPECNDQVRLRLLQAFEHFIDVDRRTDLEVARMARDMGIDIAVDLTGFTQNARTGIFAMRAAPVQVSYLGYPGTLGTDYMDYLVADRVVVPEASRRHYAEKIIYLPDSYQANDSTREIAEVSLSREELGLPRVGIVFCCFNRSFKLMPATFDCWMRILKRVEGSVLWLTEGDQAAVAQLRQHASSRGIDAGRLVFAQPVPSTAAHLARHRAADLFLDTQPFNAHTTASDALWAGLPVLTCIGEAFPGRVAASLLTAIGLPELITTTLADYENLAVRLAAEPRELAQLRQKLACNRPSMPLYDTPRFARNLEAAFVQVYERSQAGQPPDHIVLGA